MIEKDDNPEVIIIGGGLAGLTTAALVARSGKSVTLFEESSSEIGGRGRTSVHDGYYFNQGPHALYIADVGAKILQELGVEYTGRNPLESGYEIKDFKKYRVLVNSRSNSTTEASESTTGKVF